MLINYFNLMPEEEWNTYNPHKRGNYHFMEYVTAMYNAWPATTSEDRARKQEVYKYLEQAHLNSGYASCALELMLATKHSRKKYLSTQGHPDIFVPTENGGSVPAEVKTNGGCVQDMYLADDGKLYGNRRAKYIIITLYYKNSIALRELEPRLIPYADFEHYFRDINPKCVKLKKKAEARRDYASNQYEYAIVSTDVKLYRWAQDYPKYLPHWME